MVDTIYSPCQNVKCEIHEKYCLFTFLREKKANAYNQSMISFISDSIDKFEMNINIRCYAFTGSGKTFCSGADLTEIKDRSFMDAFHLQSEKLFGKITNSSKFTIAIINGAAVAGGLELCMSCDYRISSAKAIFFLPELSLGIIPAAGGIRKLLELVSIGRAKELIFMRKTWSAKESSQYGLVNKVTPKKKLMDSAMNLILDVIEFDSLAFMLAKQSINHYHNSSESLKNFDKLSQSLLTLLNQIELKEK